MKQPKVIRHAYIDESKRPNSGFMLCAVTVIEGDVAEYRNTMKSLRPNGAARLHMKNVRGADRMKIVSAVAQLEAHSRIYVVKKRCSEREARDMALRSAFLDLNGMDVARVVVESCDQDPKDRQVIRHALGPSPDMTYDHEPASMNNPLLALPDVHAWAWGRGGIYKAAIKHRITEIRVP